MKTFWRLLVLIAPHWKWMLLAWLLGVLTVGSNIGLLATGALLIARAALHPPIGTLFVLTGGVRLFGFLRAALRYGERYISHEATFRVLGRLRTWFYTVLEPLAPARLQQYHSGDLLSRIVGDVETLKEFYLRALAPPLVALAVLAGTGWLLAAFDPRMAYVLTFFFLLAGVAAPLLIQHLGRGVSRRLGEVRAALNAHLVDSIRGVTELLAFGQAQRQLGQVAALSRELQGLQGRQVGLTGLSASLTSLAMHLAMWLVVVLALPQVAAGELEGVYLAVLPLITLGAFEAVPALPMALQHLRESLAAADRLFSLAEAPPAVAAGAAEPPGKPTGQPAPDAATRPAPGPSPGSAPQRYDLRAEGLRFRYGSGEPWALDGIRFDLPEGRRLAIVGPSGAGKSTLVNLLLRFWDYEEGTLYLGGRELRAYDPEGVRQLLGVVSQQTHLFNGTIRQNLLLARPEAGPADLERAVREAGLEAFVQNLPQGLDTFVGEGGFKLSGGERQRVAIARALLKDAPILVLDEPTTGLDPVTEQQVMAAIYRLMAGRTTLVITHRLVGLEAMDQILVLAGGRVVEQGTQAELLQREGLFSRLWHLQHQVLAADPWTHLVAYPPETN